MPGASPFRREAVLETQLKTIDREGVQTLRILLVEDDPSDLYLVKDMLSEAWNEAPPVDAPHGEGPEGADPNGAGPNGAGPNGSAGPNGADPNGDHPKEGVPHELLHADTLRDALAVLAREQVGLVLTDLSLPDSDRLKTFQALRQAAPDVPVVILSGLQDEALAVEAVQQGAQDYLIKGEVEPATLRRAIRYAVERYRYTEPLRRSHERFQSTLEESEVATLVVDRGGGLLHANGALLRLLGCQAASELSGRRVEVAGPGPARLELSLEGGARHLDARATETVWAGQLAWLVTVRDLAPPPGEVTEQGPPSRFEGLRSASPAMRELFATCERVAPTPASVLLLGETGTGKELLARAIHNRSGRTGRFVAVNCAAIPEELIESELFGHERGAFTGAMQSRPGLFRQAEGGTLMLDEVGSLAMSAQLSLLRALQERMVRPVGGRAEVPVDVRVIAATSEPMFEAVKEGRFREDLLYRLDVIRIEVPPLRERPEDVLHLFRHFCEELSRRYELTPPRVGPGFLQAMLTHAWPGNVRQLENFTERLLLTGPGECATARQFHELARPVVPPAEPPPGPRAGAAVGTIAGALGVDVSLSLSEFIERQEQSYVAALLNATQGRMNEAAQRAGVDRRTLLRKLRKHGLDRADFK